MPFVKSMVEAVLVHESAGEYLVFEFIRLCTCVDVSVLRPVLLQARVLRARGRPSSTACAILYWCVMRASCYYL